MFGVQLKEQGNHDFFFVNLVKMANKHYTHYKMTIFVIPPMLIVIFNIVLNFF